MADDQLDIPDQPMTPNERAIISQNADWARTFAPSATNIAQRKRYQEALDTERQTQVGENEQAFQSRLATDKGFRDLYFKDQNARMQQARVAHDMDLSQRKFEMEQQLFPLKMENERNRMEVQRSGMERALRKESLDAQIAKRSEDQTSEFESNIQSMIDRDVNPHSKEFADGLARAYAKTPYADKNVVKQWFGQAKIEADPEVFQQKISELGIDPKNISVSLGQNGWTLAAKPPILHEDVQMRSDEHTLDSLKVKLQDPKNTDEDYKAYLQERIKTIGDRIKSKAPVQTGESAPAATPQAKTLDKDTASKLLTEAGGDKDKARKLARERGFSF